MQIPLADWPNELSKEIATINPADIAEYLGSRLEFERGFDDLDAFSVAIFLIEGKPFALLLYDHIPSGNFTLVAMRGVPDDLSIRQFLMWSQLPEDSIVWRRT